MTSDERREVAENLREQLRYMRINNSYDEDVNVVDCGNSAYRNIAGSVEPYGNFEKGNYVHIVERLADLIDPTCAMEYGGYLPESVKGMLGVYFCSECGSPIYNDMSPSYCPYCGARVVRGGED